MFKKHRTTTSFEHLSDELLFEILCRLPSYSIAVWFKTVSKRWCSLISDPLLATQGYLMHRDTKDENPSSALLLTVKMRDDYLVTSVVTPPHMTRNLRSPILSFDFLPYLSKVVAMFRDLVLCFRVEPLTQVGMFYVCNPLTKQWMALPPSDSHQEPVLGAVLVCQDDGAFRVVVTHSVPDIHAHRYDFRDYKLVFYLSKTRQWKNIHIRFHIHPSRKLHLYPFTDLLSMFVCNGMVCFNHQLYFGAFNPFDVNSAFSRTLTAIRMPWPAVVEKILECCGKLVAVKTYVRYRRFGSNENVVESLTELSIMGLNLDLESDEESLRWEQVLVFRGNIRVKELICGPRGCYHNKPTVVGVHPNKEHLVYLLINDTNQLVLFDSRSQTLEPVTRIAPHDEFVALNKLELPCWPTPFFP